MMVIGVLGGIASGKSLVTEQLRELGAETLDADRVGHEVLREPEVKEQIRRRWGAAVFSPDGEVNRAAVARIVFEPAPAGPPELTFLEQITHPRISQRLRARIDDLARNDGVPALVLDAPVLLKAGWDRFCQQILFVEATREQRLARAASRGWNPAEFAVREAAQEPLAEKRARASYVIDNTGSAAETYAQVRQFWRSVVSPEAG